MTHAIEALYKSDKYFQNELQVIEKTKVVSTKVTFNDLHTLKPEQTGMTKT